MQPPSGVTLGAENVTTQRSRIKIVAGKEMESNHIVLERAALSQSRMSELVCVRHDRLPSGPKTYVKLLRWDEGGENHG